MICRNKRSLQVNSPTSPGFALGCQAQSTNHSIQIALRTNIATVTVTKGQACNNDMSIIADFRVCHARTMRQHGLQVWMQRTASR